MTALLAIEGLHVRYPLLRSPLANLLAPRNRHIDVLVDISLSVAAGETLALVGESGSGKTTLGRSVIGLVKTAAGRIFLNGEDVSAQSSPALRQRRRSIAMTFQDPVASLSPRLNVLSLVTEPYKIQDVQPPGDGDLAQAGLRLLDRVGLPPYFATRYPHELSGGQARRVGIARALALQPKIIIADEPTAGLDVSIQGATLNLLSQVQRDDGLSLLLITHNLAVVRHVADRIAVIYMGRIVEIGTTEQILTHPEHPYTRLLVAAQPTLQRGATHPAPVASEIPSLLRRPVGCEFHQRCGDALPVCREQRPRMTLLADGREVRCHLAGGGDHP